MSEQPFLKPLLALLHSRRFVLLLLTLVCFFLIPTIPSSTIPDAWKMKLADVLFYGGTALFVGLSGEDIIAASKAHPTDLEEVIIGIVDEVIHQLNDKPADTTTPANLPAGGNAPGAPPVAS